MAADEVLVRTAAAHGIASLRFYGWSAATLSLGYFQPAQARLADPRLAALPWVRRPSGGAALVHHHEITYALAVPPGEEWNAGGPWMPRMHRVIAGALEDYFIEGLKAVTALNAVKHGEVLCFQQLTPGDLICGASKVVGSAQRKYCRALVQHGSILLKRSEHALLLPGLEELTARPWPTDWVRQVVETRFRIDTKWNIAPAIWSDGERIAIAALAREKYGTSAWNERR
jgi:lipoate-protein ligase A